MRKRWGTVIGASGLLVVLVAAATALVDEPLRAYVEQKMNRSLKGYSVRIGALHFHPLGFSLTLEDLTLTRTDEPESPVAQIPRWTANLHWKALLFGRLVNDQYIERPTFHLTRTVAKHETQDEMSLKDRGWQDAVESIYPFKINQVTIRDADLTYVDEAKPERPLRFHQVNVSAFNIRNVHSRDQHYPSELALKGMLFDAGKVSVEGRADFLAEPHVAVKADILLDDVPLGAFIPVTARYNIHMTGGTLSAEGSVEYAPAVKVVDLKRLTIDGLRVDYVHSKRTESAETARAKATVETAQQVNADQETLIRIERISLVDSELGFVNQATKPDYRLFLTDADLDLEHYSTQLREGPASLSVRGKFMGTGDTEVTGLLRPEHDSSDFEVKIKIAGTQIRSMNDLLRAYGKFDVAAGVFSCYAELMLHHGAIQGYVKPLVRKLDVYNKEQDRGKDALEKVREGAIEDLSSWLENLPRQEVATKADISGSTRKPRTETVQIIVGLIQNAFFKAILPGFEREFGSKHAAPNYKAARE